MSYNKLQVPAQGKKITASAYAINVPDNPIIPYIEGDGIGVDITPVMIKVVDAAVNKAYGGRLIDSLLYFIPCKHVASLG